MVDVNTVKKPGVVTKQTLKWVEKQLKEAQSSGTQVIAASHQNLLQHNSIFSEGFQMGNAQKLLTLYEKYNVLCNLSGHIHLQHIEQSPSGFIEFVTSSLITSPIQYGTLVLKDFSIDYKTVPVDVSGWAKKNGLTNPDLLNFAKYAQMFFWNTSFRKAEQELSSNINIHNKRILAEFFADINTAYFAGRTDTIDQKEELVAEWVQQSSFLSTYLKSISDDGFQNHNEYSFYLGDETK